MSHYHTYTYGESLRDGVLTCSATTHDGVTFVETAPACDVHACDVAELTVRADAELYLRGFHHEPRVPWTSRAWRIVRRWLGVA